MVVRVALMSVVGTAGFGVFAAVLPLLLAQAIDHVFPIGLVAVSDRSQFGLYLGVSFVVMTTVAGFSITRTTRRVVLGVLDGRPALLGSAASALNEPLVYGRRARALAVISVASFAAAVALSSLIASGVLEALFPVLYLCLLCVCSAGAALEVRDLKKTALLKRGLG